jgi:hypothetical protein
MRARLRRQTRDVLTLEQHLAGCRLQIAGQAVEQRGFSGAVRPDQAENIALLQRHGCRVDGPIAAEGFGDVASLKEHG